MKEAHLEEQVAAATERYRALLAVSEAIAAHRDLSALFQELAGRLHLVVQFDALALVLHAAGKDFLYGGALAAATLILSFILIPSLTTTTIAAWTDRSLEMERMNVRENRPEVQEASLRIADYYQQHGIAGTELAQMASTVLGSFARSEAVAQGIQRGLQFLSLLVAGIGLPVVVLLLLSSRYGPVAAPHAIIPDTLPKDVKR